MLEQGSSARLVLPAILGEWRACLEIQNPHMKFVSLKVINLFLCTFLKGPLLILFFICLDRGIAGVDQPWA